jgi:hypothetical protein
MSSHIPTCSRRRAGVLRRWQAYPDMLYPSPLQVTMNALSSSLADFVSCCIRAFHAKSWLNLSRRPQKNVAVECSDINNYRIGHVATNAGPVWEPKLFDTGNAWGHGRRGQQRTIA